jgi:hypothetical protein
LAVQKKEYDMSVFVIAAVAAAIFVTVAFVGARSGKSSILENGKTAIAASARPPQIAPQTAAPAMAGAAAAIRP